MGFLLLNKKKRINIYELLCFNPLYCHFCCSVPRELWLFSLKIQFGNQSQASYSSIPLTSQKALLQLIHLYPRNQSSYSKSEAFFPQENIQMVNPFLAFRLFFLPHLQVKEKTDYQEASILLCPYQFIMCIYIYLLWSVALVIQN